ncbi:unnamed protein product [Oikopleura dioica]|uniref:Sodium-coupled monocarboxylate transporter 1 n=1 Tax=Oikopleura dioica TaxID=34765 RepID=E4XUH0_OIKDI|nr:unnamed protein product [Oikopleura dioica]
MSASTYGECVQDGFQITCLTFYNFTVADYIIFSFMLCLSAGVGVFFAYRARNSETVEDYLLAGRTMHFFPTSLSIMCTALSAITILGTPSEFYLYGGMYIWAVACFAINLSLSAEIFLPIFYHLKIRSTYEYLELRFHSITRKVTMAMFLLATIVSTGVAIYAPATAISAVTSIDLNLAILSCGLVCVFYTTLGGMKAVVWTDVVQSVWMISGLLAITIYSAVNIGYDEIWQKAKDSGRTEFFVTSWNPTVRNTIQAFLIGKTFGLDGYSFCVSQNFVQRFLACRSLAHAKGSAYMSIVWFATIITFCLTSGFALIIYYELCDPAAAGFLETTDQLMPWLTTYLFQENAGVSAIYVSGAFAASLSTVSSALSSMANALISDFLYHWTNKLSEKKQLIICKSLVLFLGGCCIGFAYMAASLRGGILEAALAIPAIVGGPTWGVFMLAVLFPFVEFIGVSVGMLTGVAACTWMYIGRNIAPIPTEIVEHAGKLEVNTDHCMYENGTMFPGNDVQPEYIENSPLLSFYNISVHYIGTLGFSTTVVFTLLTSTIVHLFVHKGKYNAIRDFTVTTSRIFGGLSREIKCEVKTTSSGKYRESRKRNPF